MKSDTDEPSDASRPYELTIVGAHPCPIHTYISTHRMLRVEGTTHEAVVHVDGHVRLVLVHALPRKVPCGQSAPVLAPPGNVVPPVRRRDRLTCGGAEGADVGYTPFNL